MMQSKLEQKWNPEQITQWLRLTYPDRPGSNVGHETYDHAISRGGKAV